MNNEFYLKPNAVLQPLFDRWNAWAHLISPATAAMNVLSRHIKIMKSYIQSPQIHSAAVKNPKMLGGPFMDYPTNRVNEIQNLLSETEKKHSQSIKFAEAIAQLDHLLKSSAKGSSLEPLYSEVPDILKGYIELVYDLNNNPSFRFFEPLLYTSDFYSKGSQSIALWLAENDDRPFCLSTPQLDEPNVLHLDLSFDNKGIDILSSMKRKASSIDEAVKVLGVTKAQRGLFDTFFTQQEPPVYQTYQGEKARMRYFGHACILIETKDVSILVDPLISYYGYESTIEHFSDIHLPDSIDFVLITHNHQDHIVLETLLPLRHKIKNIIIPATTSGALQDPNLKLVFQHCGFNNIIEINEMERIQFADCTITGIPFTGEHSDLNIRTKTCFHISFKKFSFLFMADSRIMERKLYEHIQKVTGYVDVLFLGMECDGAPLSWLYGPLVTATLNRDQDQARRLSGSDFEKGMHLVDIFRPSEVYVYAMGQEPWLKFISSIKYSPDSNPIVQSNRLVKECQQRGILAERLFGEKELLYEYKTLEKV